ncbi:MAG: glycerol-3-phosphate acyltransferase [Caldilineaceae bacterium]|nr:glycerol-3-phosphate acyltransferase [Caldilineaceae bacterium]
MVLWFLLAFLSGSLPFSVWVGRLFLGTDIRTVGDANPGATNVLRAGGKGLAALALLLDFLKGALPVSIAYFVLDYQGWALLLVAILPVLGHAFTPFLRGRGGKAVATSGGVWCGLTVWEGPTVGGLLLGLCTYLLGANGWAVLTAISGMVIYLGLTPPTWNGLDARPERWLIWSLGLLNLLVVGWKHRADLRIPPQLRRSRQSEAS